LAADAQVALDQAEGDLSSFRLYELGERYPVKVTGDLSEVRGIHRHLFQDVYPWAGQTRSVDLRKPGGEPFLPVSRVQTGAGYVFEELRAETTCAGWAVSGSSSGWLITMTRSTTFTRSGRGTGAPSGYSGRG
jgi:cell filamentation protein